jgi:hypothetical protein
MRAKIAPIVVLASFLALSALGVGMAGADPLAQSTPVAPAATTTTAVPSLQAPACANGLDDDGDGLVDLADPDCADPTDVSEAPAPDGSGAVGPAASPATSADKPAKAGGFEHGSAIGGSPNSGGVTRNESLGDSSGGGSSGGLSAPSATGGGDQPLAGGADGGL